MTKLCGQLGIDESDARSVGSEMETDSSDDDYVDELPQALPSNRTRPRNSVSAEAYGSWNRKEDFQAWIIPKSDATKNKIRDLLSQAFMFSAVSDEDLEVVIDAMEEVKYAGGDTVIKQGDDGDTLFLVEEGAYKCARVMAKGQEPTYLKTYHPGEAFGELALLYNAPRAATIYTETGGLLYSLDRNTFNHIVKDAARKKRERYETFLSKVKILQSMEAYERTSLSDAFVDHKFSKGDYVIKEGEDGHCLFFLVWGTAVATKVLEAGKRPQELMTYKQGDYFGERALIKNEPRAANVIATSDLECVSIDRHSFRRLLGPIEDILKRNMEIYNWYV